MGSYDDDIQLSVDLNPKNVVRTAEDLNNNIKRIFNEATGANISEPFKELQISMDGAVIQAKNLLSSMDQLQQSNQAYSEGVPTDEFMNLTDQLNHVNNQMVLLTAKATSMLNALNPAPISIFRKVLSGLASVLGGIAKVNVKALKLEFKGLKFAIKASIKPMLMLAKIAPKLAARGISSGVKKLANSIKSLGKHSGSTSDALNKGFKSFIRYGLGVRSLFALINKLRRALIEGFGNLAQFDDPFNQSVSNILTALNTLKNSFASAFAPIIEVVSPILTYFINLIAEAVTKVGMLIAALTGKSSYVRALPVYQNYAESVDKTAESSSKAAKATNEQNKATKDLKKTIAGFDDVEILQDNNDTGSSGGSGGDGSAIDPSGAVATAFENLPIGSAFSDLAKKLKEAWKDADFSEFGKIVGEKLKAALDSIPWDTIKSVLRKVAKSIATFLNGFLEVPGLFTSIGRTIAEGLNSAFEFVNSFVENFHWDSLGTAVKDLIIGALSNIDWPLIYDTLSGLGEGFGTTLETALDNPEIWSNVLTTISNGLNSIVYGIQSFLTAVNWGSIASNIGSGLNDGIEAFDWNALGDTLSRLINAAFDIWYNFITTFDFAKFGSHIGETLSKAIKQISWSRGGNSVAQTINKLYVTLNGIIATTDWEALGKAVVDTIVGFFKDLDWSQFGTFLSLCILKLANFLTTIFKEIDWENLPKQIVKAIKSYLSGFDWSAIANATGGLIGAAFKAIVKVGGTLWESMRTVGRNIISGGFKGIKDKLASIGNWIVTNIFKPFIDGFKAAFGISSPASEMIPYGKFIISGILKGILSIIKNIGEWIKEHVFNPMIAGLKTAFGLNGENSPIFELGSNVIGALKNGLISAVEGIADWIKTNIVEPIINGLQDLVAGVTGLFSDNGEDQLFINYCETSTEAVNTYADAMEYLKTKVEGTDGTRAWRTLNDAIKELARTQKISADDAATLSAELYNSEVNGMSFGDAINNVSEFLQNHNVKVEDLNRVLGLTPDATTEAAGGFDGLKESADESDTATLDLQESIKKFDSLGWTTPVKIALISAAIGALESSGKLSKEQAQGLYDTLDNFDPSDPESSMKSVGEAFENAGVSAGDFEKAIVYATVNASGDVKAEVQEMLSHMDDLKSGMKSGGEESGKNLTGGLESELKDGKSEVVKAAGNLVKDSLDEMRDEGDMHSPSKETEKMGQDLGNGLKLGMESVESDILGSVASIVQSILDAVNVVDDFTNIGSDLISGLDSGLASGMSTVSSTAADISASIYDSLQVDGWSIGYNVCSGIYDGLSSSWSWLTSTAWNLAIDIYNTACNALGIHSPSKLFKEKVGEMIPAGLAEGIDAGSDKAISSVKDMTNDIEDEAKDMNPALTFTANVENFLATMDNILSSFSDKISTSFATLIDGLGNLNLPNVAQGKVVPYAIAQSGSGKSESISDIISSLNTDRITRNDLITILSDLFREYLDIQFYLGDEQIYRHAERGALKLTRRYNPTS